jgi:hypothetical protein
VISIYWLVDHSTECQAHIHACCLYCYRRGQPARVLACCLVAKSSRSCFGLWPSSRHLSLPRQQTGVCTCILEKLSSFNAGDSPCHTRLRFVLHTSHFKSILRKEYFHVKTTNSTEQYMGVLHLCHCFIGPRPSYRDLSANRQSSCSSRNHRLGFLCSIVPSFFSGI